MAATRSPIFFSMMDSPMLATRKVRIATFSNSAVIRRKMGATKLMNIGCNSRGGPGSKNKCGDRMAGLIFVAAKPKLKNFARNKGEMGIEHVTEKNFRSGVNDDDAHEEKLISKRVTTLQGRAGINDPGYNIAARASHSHECFGPDERMASVIVAGIADAGQRSIAAGDSGSLFNLATLLTS